MPIFYENEGCATPDQIWPGDEISRQLVENAVEQIIAADFQLWAASNGVISTFVDPGAAGPRTLTYWMVENMSTRTLDPRGINRRDMLDGFDAGKYAVPDIVACRAWIAQSEFYEIKPDSPNGVSAGRAKRRDFEKLIQDFKLLLVPGIDYNPQGSQFFRLVDDGLFQYELVLKWRRSEPGIILYKFCYRFVGQVDLVPELVVVLVGLLIMLMARGKTFSPSPFPGRVPIPT